MNHYVRRYLLAKRYHLLGYSAVKAVVEVWDAWTGEIHEVTDRALCTDRRWAGLLQ